MAFGTVLLHPATRRFIGVVLSCICILQFVAGILILGYGSYFIENLQWKVSIISAYDSGTLNIITIILGSLISVVHLCGAKMLYDSGKELTRHRFQSFLLMLVIIFTCLLAMEFVAAVTCKIHFSWFDEIFENEQGFIKAIKEYGENADLRMRIDQLQLEDQCCGAENFSDWLNEDWVSTRFNPLFNPSLTPEQKSLYYPWQVSPLSESAMEQVEISHIPAPTRPIAQEQYPHEQYQPQPQYDQYQSPAALFPVNPVEQYYGAEYGTNPDEREISANPVDMSKLEGFERRPRSLKRFQRDGSSLSKLIDQELAQRSQLGDKSQQGSQYIAPTDDGHLLVVPWSCCSSDYLGPCVHDYVTQYHMVNLLRAKVSWNGNSLYQRGCWLLLKKEYVSFMFSYMVLLWVTVIIQVLLILLARYLQTSVENIELYNREDSSAPGYLWGESSMAALRKAKKYQKGRTNDGNSNEDLEEVSLLEEYDRLKEKHRKTQKLRKLLLKSNMGPGEEESELDSDDDEKPTRVHQSERKMKLNGIEDKSRRLFSDIVSTDNEGKRHKTWKKKMKSTMTYLPLPDGIKHFKSKIAWPPKHHKSSRPKDESEA